MSIISSISDRRTTRRSELGAATLLSCWTILDGDDITPDDWRIFNREDGVTIVSSVEAVGNLLRELPQEVLENWDFREGTVQYFNPDERIPEFEIMDAWRYKRHDYQKQREYRFAFLKGSPADKVQMLVFYVREPKRYIQKFTLDHYTKA
jgi:hypothetical protein